MWKMPQTGALLMPFAVSPTSIQEPCQTGCQIGAQNWRAPGGVPPSALITRQPAYKPGSGRHANAFACVTAIPLGLQSPEASSNLPGRPDPDTIPKRLLAHRFAPSLFGLAPGGVCHAADVTAGAVRSYRTISPLPRRTQKCRGGMFSVALSLDSHPPDVIRHRLSAEPGLSSPATFRFRRSGRPTD
jgi:hypothetical protein